MAGTHLLQDVGMIGGLDTRGKREFTVLLSALPHKTMTVSVDFIMSLTGNNLLLMFGPVTFLLKGLIGERPSM